jgi:hypothetical protein
MRTRTIQCRGESDCAVNQAIANYEVSAQWESAAPFVPTGEAGVVPGTLIAVKERLKLKYSIHYESEFTLQLLVRIDERSRIVADEISLHPAMSV